MRDIACRFRSLPPQLLLEGTHKPLGDAVALRRLHEARAGFDTEEVPLALEMAAHGLGTLIVTNHQALCVVTFTWFAVRTGIAVRPPLPGCPTDTVPQEPQRREYNA